MIVLKKDCKDENNEILIGESVCYIFMIIVNLEIVRPQNSSKFSKIVFFQF